MIWILEHHYALAGVSVAALLVGVAIAGLCVVADQSEERRSRKLGGGGSVASIGSVATGTDRETDGTVAAEHLRGGHTRDARRTANDGHGDTTQRVLPTAEDRQWTIARTDDYTHLNTLIDEVRQ